MTDEFLQKIYEIYKLPYYIRENDKEYWCEQKREQNAVFKDHELREQILEAITENKGPVLYLEDDMTVFYGAFQWKKTICIVGPAARNALTKKQQEKYVFQHKLGKNATIDKMNLQLMSKVLSIIYLHYTGINVADEDIIFAGRSKDITEWTSEKDVEIYQLDQSENDRGHNSLLYEERIRRIVREGNLKEMKLLLSEDRFDTSNIGIVASNNTKQMEYLVLTMIVLIARSAMDGGMNPEKAYQLSDVYLQKLAQCDSVEAMGKLGAKAQIEYTQKVKEAREQRAKSNYIEECKDYIAKNLRKPFKVGEIAPAIGVNRSYLARKFSETEGITIQQYVMKERCRHAANLLKFSKYPISIISEYFCFSSQSHFGRQFKEIYGMTPKEYRLQNRLVESYDKEEKIRLK